MLAGAHVGDFDSIDLFECLHNEPRAVEYFYAADEELKAGWIKHDSREAVKALDTLLGFIVELVMEDYPHSHVQVCKDFDKEGKADWTDLKRIMGLARDHSTGIEVYDNKLYFNKKDLSHTAEEMIEDYLGYEFGHLGWNFGKGLDEASKDDGLFLF